MQPSNKKRAVLITTMDGVQFDITMVTGGSGAAIDSIVGGLTDITKHLNILNENFIGFSQKSLNGFNEVDKAVKKTESGFERMSRVSFGLNNISQGLSGMTNDLNNAVEPGIKLNSSLKDLQAITGITETQMNSIGDAARKTAKVFGIDAAQSVESYKIYLSKLGPELANNQTALDGFGKNAAILSKQLKGDTVGATELIATAMNQYGVSMKDPIAAMKTSGAMMNIMSAAAQEGSAELPQIKSALEESGMMAKTANVSFTELNSAIQVLDKAGKKGAEGGVAIRNVLAEISQGNMMPRQQLAMLQAAGVNIETLSDKSLTFSDRLKALAPIVNDNAAMVKLFGKENVAAGIALVQNTGEIDRLTGKITGTNSAVTMADTVMGSYQERVNRIKAAISDFGIKMFEVTKPFMPFITMGMGTIQVMANMAQAGTLFSAIAGNTMVKRIGSFVASLFVQTAATGTATVAQEGLNTAMTLNPIGFIIVAVAALAAGLVYAYNKSETFRAALSGIMEVGKLLGSVFTGVGNIIAGVFTHDFTQFKKGLGQVAVAAVDIGTGGIGKAFDKGYNESMHESLVDKVKAAVDEENKKKEQNITIAGITTQGDANKNSPLAGYDPHNRKGKGEHKTGKEMASNVTAGGSRPTTIYLTIQKVIGIGELKTTNLVGAAKEAGNQVVEEVLMAIQSVNGKVSVQ